MPSLSETQAKVREAVVASNYLTVAPLLTGGAGPIRRLAIHRRHYHASLVEVLRGRFPAASWLVGGEAVTTAAAAFVIEHPPRVFCMAEFGEAFPAFLAARPGLAHLGYLEDFACLEWEVGRVSVAVDGGSLGVEWLHAVDPHVLGQCGLALQPGVAYVQSNWGVDELMRLYLADNAPGTFAMRDQQTWIEIRGARGTVAVNSLEAGEWQFRRGLASGLSVEEAAGAALDADSVFDAGRALVQLLAAGLVTSPRPFLQATR